MASSSSTTTVIGKETFVRGRVSGSGDLEIVGRVEGDVAVSGEIVIDATALVAANVAGARIVVRGAVKGDLTAEETLVIESGARVVGDLRAPRITIAQGGLVRGHVQTGAAGAPRAARAAAPARATKSEAQRAPAAASAPKATPKPAPKAAAKAPPPPPPAKKSSANHTKSSARATNANPIAAVRIPPAPIVPILKKGTKAVQKKINR